MLMNAPGEKGMLAGWAREGGEAMGLISILSVDDDDDDDVDEQQLPLPEHPESAKSWARYLHSPSCFSSSC